MRAAAAGEPGMICHGPSEAAAKWQDVFPTITTGYCYPWEDVRLK